MKFSMPMTCIALLYVALFTSFADAKIVKKTVPYTVAGKAYEGYVAFDDAITTPRAGVLVVHNWKGLSDETKSKADQLAELGYIAFAADIYGKGIRPTDSSEAGKIAGSYKKDRALLRTHMQDSLRELELQPGVDKNRIAVIGYCFGGTAALELARAGAMAKGFVVFHGGLDSLKPDDAKQIKGKILVLHGADDPYSSATDVAAFENEMRTNHVDWEIVKYGGAVHSFTEKAAGDDNSKGAAYNAEADRRSWRAMQDFFKEIL